MINPRLHQRPSRGRFKIMSAKAATYNLQRTKGNPPATGTQEQRVTRVLKEKA